MELLIVFVLLVLLDVAAMRWGYDSRDAARLGAPYARHAGLLAPPETPAPRRARPATALHTVPSTASETRPAARPLRPLRGRPVHPRPVAPISSAAQHTAS